MAKPAIISQRCGTYKQEPLFESYFGCGKCGRELDPSYVYCPRCGERIEWSEGDKEAKHEGSSRKSVR